ncbi:MAG TPA: fatty acid desaturase [Steroidobacteraceae bacterium]|nr:fatty acid desaturase [Steroidobacteraceae bacterium]
MTGATAASVAVRHARTAIEWQTLLLLGGVYAAWLAVTYQYGHWPLWLLAPLGALIVTLHSSLQHEIVHGHPTRWYAVNRLLGILPLALWLPYDRYRTMHRIHHRDERLTDPVDDPESFYWLTPEWERLSAPSRLLLRVQQTLAGRVVVGSFWHIGAFLVRDVRALARGEREVLRTWLEHVAWCVPVVLWVKWVCGMPLWIYFLAIAVPANGIQLIRSFAEHRARPQVAERIAVVEDSWLLGPLFLFNNLHALHHESPLVPWYEIPARYRLIRERLIAENGGLVYRTYFDVARRFLFRPHDVLLHPSGGVPVAPPRQTATLAQIATI